MSKIFEISLQSKGKVGLYAELKLPATAFEIADTFAKLRISAATDPYESEMIDCKLDYLPQFILPSANVYELNHLAQRLETMSDWELGCFEGMTMMDAIKKDYAPIPLERLINMTHSTDNCQIAYEAHDDKSLGKFYVDNDFPVIPENLPEVLYELLDYEAIGRKMRTGEGGVFTEKGYVVHSGEMTQSYHEGDAIPKSKPSHTIELEVCKVFFDDGNHIEAPLLPADDGMMERVLIQLEANDAEECSFRATDCIVPKLTPVISNELYASEGNCYGAANELATQLKRLDDAGKLTTYRAMIEAAPADLTLEEAIDLSKQVENFSLISEVTSPSDYALHQLNKYQIELADDLYRGANLYEYGKKLIAEKGIQLTSYGMLWTMNFEPVLEMLCPDNSASPIDAQGMQMG